MGCGEKSHERSKRAEFSQASLRCAYLVYVPSCQEIQIFHLPGVSTSILTPIASTSGGQFRRRFPTHRVDLFRQLFPHTDITRRSNALVGEGHVHHARRMPFSRRRLIQTTFAEDVDPPAIPSVHTRQNGRTFLVLVDRHFRQSRNVISTLKVPRIGEIAPSFIRSK